MKTGNERYEVLLNRLKSWERERATNRFKLAHVADVSIARLREEMERRWPGTLSAEPSSAGASRTRGQ